MTPQARRRISSTRCAATSARRPTVAVSSPSTSRCHTTVCQLMGRPENAAQTGSPVEGLRSTDVRVASRTTSAGQDPPTDCSCRTCECAEGRSAVGRAPKPDEGKPVASVLRTAPGEDVSIVLMLPPRSVGRGGGTRADEWQNVSADAGLQSDVRRSRQEASGGAGVSGQDLRSASAGIPRSHSSSAVAPSATTPRR